MQTSEGTRCPAFSPIRCQTSLHRELSTAGDFRQAQLVAKGIADAFFWIRRLILLLSEILTSG
jgi:hypothetical protein